MAWVLGLTGGIGSGKSAVSERFQALGSRIVDTDLIARRLTAGGGAAMPALREAFGDAVVTPDGALDRGSMRQRIFGDPAERQRLEAILHPMIRDEVDAQLRRPAGADFSYTVLVVPLLVETGAYAGLLDRVLVVDCPVELQIARVIARNGLGRQEALAILSAQATRERRLAIADDVIVNDRGWDTLDEMVLSLDARYRALAAAKHDEADE